MHQTQQMRISCTFNNKIAHVLLLFKYKCAFAVQFLLVILMKKYRLRSLREDRDLTQEQVAKVLNMTRTNYGRIEQESVTLSFDDAVLLSDFFEVSLEDLLISKKKNSVLTKDDQRLIRSAINLLESFEKKHQYK